MEESQGGRMPFGVEFEFDEYKLYVSFNNL